MDTTVIDKIHIVFLESEEGLGELTENIVFTRSFPEAYFMVSGIPKGSFVESALLLKYDGTPKAEEGTEWMFGQHICHIIPGTVYLH